MDNLEKIFQRMNVLVIDDMAIIRSMVKGCLMELGVRKIMVETNGKSAWDTLESTGADLIICDWDMPQLSGLELLKLVRGSEKHSHIPFLMLTATSDKDGVVSVVEAGVSDYLTKPFQPQDLEYRIIKLLRKVKFQ